MKRLYFLVCVLLVSVVAVCDTHYRLAAWQGQVFCKPQGSASWRTVRTDMEFSTYDSLRIEEQSLVMLQGTEHNGFFRYDRKGKCSVYNVIKECQMRDRETIFKKVLNFLSSLTAPQRASYEKHGAAGKRVGGSNRGEMINVDSLVQSLCYIAHHTILGTLLQSNSKLVLHRFENSEGVAFGLENLSSKGLYVNVLHINCATERVQLCYPYDNDSLVLFLPPQSCLNMDSIYFSNTKHDAYVLFGCKNSYPVASVHNSLSSKRKADLNKAQYETPYIHKNLLLFSK